MVNDHAALSRMQTVYTAALLVLVSIVPPQTSLTTRRRHRRRPHQQPQAPVEMLAVKPQRELAVQMVLEDCYGVSAIKTTVFVDEAQALVLAVYRL